MIPCPVRGKAKSLEICNAFVAGAPKHAYGYCFYGVNASNLRDWKLARNSGKDWYYIDGSFFDSVRGQQFRVAKNCVQTDAVGKASDGKRFTALGLTVKPWVTYPEGWWLVIEQSEAFMRDVAGDTTWFAKHVAWAKRTGRRVKIRPWSADKLALVATLKDDLKGACGLIAHSSAAIVTAALEGVPFEASSMSALAGMVYSNTEAADPRLHFMQVLADNQFTLEEMRDGTAWRALNP